MKTLDLPPVEIHSIVLVNSVYPGHTLLITRDVLGQAITAKATKNERLEYVLESFNAIPVSDRRGIMPTAKVRPESYPSLGTLRRGGFSVL